MGSLLFSVNVELSVPVSPWAEVSAGSQEFTEPLVITFSLRE
jgi:hypothetical protein